MARETDGDWWQGGVIYQIYPRSFADSDGDGVGDLAGITAHLDHVASLGVDAIWISPFFRSPMADFGYDVEDHRAVDPLFGDDDDLDALIAAAHARGLKVMVDLVLSHTSDTHPWFVESRKSRTGPYAERYVWADPQPDGSPPNNWLSIFGGVAWQWEPRRRQYYLHNFLVEQPDLNFHDPAVRAEALDIARFWLKRGIDGFRLDTVNFYFHDQDLRSNPPTQDAAGDISVAGVNPYSMQDHVYDKNRPETDGFLRDLGSLLAEYGGMALGEVGAARSRSLKLMAEYTRPGRIQLCYAFDLLGPAFSAEHFTTVIERFEAQGAGWPCWAFSNHDVIRTASRLCPAGVAPDRIARLCLGMLLSLRGAICLYQGEELGLIEADIPRERLVDPYGIAFWPEFKGRDGCRTPMPWHDSADAGFGSDDPWLPIPDAHRAAAVAAQEKDSGSVLHLARHLLGLRRANPALRRGAVEVVHRWSEVLVLRRTAEETAEETGGETVYAAFNLSPTPMTWTADAGVSLEALAGDGAVSGDAIALPPYGWSWARPR